MARPAFARFGVLIVLVAALGLGVDTAATMRPAAQATPVPAAPASTLGRLPAGVASVPLAVGAVTTLPSAPARLVLERLVLDPGEGFATTVVGAELVWVGTGTPSLVNQFGLSAPAATGQSFASPAGASYSMRNDTPQQVALLRLRLVPSGAAEQASSALAAAATPVPAPEVSLLLAAEIATLPAAPAVLFIERVTFAPGAALPEGTFAGPVGLLTQQGVLNVADPSGIEGRLEAGQALVFPAGVVNRERNAGTEPAVVLMVGVVPAGQPALVPVGGAAVAQTFDNPGPITIPTQGQATPYPSTIEVAGAAPVVAKVVVTLRNLSHRYPAEIDVLLEGPQGQTVVLLSDAGFGNVTDITLTFDDEAANALPESGQLVSGTFRPTNVNTGDSFATPAPAASPGATLSVFAGTDPNGTWRLWVVDDTSSDGGAIAGGWSLTLEP